MLLVSVLSGAIEASRTVKLIVTDVVNKCFAEGHKTFRDLYNKYSLSKVHRKVIHLRCLAFICLSVYLFGLQVVLFPHRAKK